MDPASLIPIGTVGAAHGLRGEVRLHLYYPQSDTVRVGLVVVLRDAKRHWTTCVASWRRVKRGLLVRFNGVEDRDAARTLTGLEVAVRRGDLPPLEPGEFYYHDVMGLPVRTRGGRDVGRVESVMSGATDILVIRGPAGEFLVPVVEGFVTEVGPTQIVVADEALE